MVIIKSLIITWIGCFILWFLMAAILSKEDAICYNYNPINRKDVIAYYVIPTFAFKHGCEFQKHFNKWLNEPLEDK